MSSTKPLQQTANHQRQRLAGKSWWKAVFPLAAILLLVLIATGIYLRQYKRAAADAPEIQPAAGAVPALKIYLPESGIYRLTQDDLRQAGWTSNFDDEDRVMLTYKGHTQPFWIDKSGDSPTLAFYGQPASGIYSTEAIYILRDMAYPEIALEVSEHLAEQGSIQTPLTENLPANGYFDTRRFEQNQLYLPQAQAEERWFWMALPAPVTQTVDIPLSGVPLSSEGEEVLAHLAVNLYSSTEAPQSPDHHLRLSVNGMQVADSSWDGKGNHLLETWFDASVLVEGENQIRLVAPGDTGVIADLTHLDWVEMSYPRVLRAKADRLDFWSPGGERHLSGFSGSVEAYDITVPDDVNRIDGLNQDAETVILDSIANHHYLVVGPAGYRRPSRIAPLSLQPDLSAQGNGADYLAIGPPDLLSPLQPLLDFRTGQGLGVMSVPVEAVYDQFNHGQGSPQAIQRFMVYAAQNWDPKPRYLLLVGDASYDPKGYLAPIDANRLPAFLVDTVYGGQTVSDVPFVQLDEDEWPDLALGLVPARTAKQVDIFVHKTLDYETSTSDPVRADGILAVADGLEASFRGDAEAFLDLFGTGVSTWLIAPESGDTETADQIQEKLGEGVSLLAYFGHGSLNMWGKDRLFTVEDAARLGNADKLPVVLNMTCLTGLYTHPTVESLAEALLFNPTGGAAAVFAPSSLTLAYDQTFLSHPLVAEIMKDPNATLGDVHLAARRQISLDSPGTRDVMMTFMLFGDPALSLPFGG